MQARQVSPTPAMSVVLVNMPASGVERPSIALGLLKAVLAGNEVPTAVVYPNLWFLDHFGLETSQALISVRPEDAIVDWLFGGVAFPDFEPDHSSYLSAIERWAPQLEASGLNRQRLLDLRRRMPAFIRWTAQRILDRRPKLVGCTSMFQQHVASLALLRTIKDLDPTVTTLLGGANCESIMGKTTHEKCAWVDYVVSGEADQLIAELIGGLLGAETEWPIASLPFGVFGPEHRKTGYPSTKTGDGVPRAITADLRDLPLPDYDDYFAELKSSLYNGLITPGLPIEFSRGCWWGAKSHCTFCGLNGGSMSYRSKPVGDVIQAMTDLSDRYATRRLEVVDNIMDMAYFQSVLPELSEREEPFDLFFETKSNLKKGQIKALADAGVHWIQPGIESLDSRVLRLMRKGCTAAQNILLLKWCRQYGIRASWSIISNFPGEDDDWYADMAAIMPSLYHLQAGVTVPLRYDRYSPYFTNPDDHGLSLRPARAYSYAYPFTDEDLVDLVYFFEERATDAVRRERPGLKAVQACVLEWRRAWKQEPPVLSMSDTAAGLVIEDSRPNGHELVLNGVHRALILESDNGPPETQAIDRLTQSGWSSDDIGDAIEDLVSARLLLRLDHRLIGLPLTKPHTRIPLPSMFPGGYVHKGHGPIEQFLAQL